MPLYFKNKGRYSIPENFFDDYNLETTTYLERTVYTLSKETREENNKDDNIVIFYLYGGSYIAKPSKEHWEFLMRLSKDLKCTIIIPEYPLIPKYNYKDVFDFVTPLYEDILNQVGKENLIVMGDSSGGGIALSLCQTIGEMGLEQPKKLLLLSPVIDLRLENPKIKEKQKEDKKLNKTNLKLVGKLFAGKDGMTNYLVNPILGPLEKLENVTVFTGTNDILNPDVYSLKEIAENQNVYIQIDETYDAGHIWMIEKANENPDKIEEGYQKVLESLKTEEK